LVEFAIRDQRAGALEAANAEALIAARARAAWIAPVRPWMS
jgi:hypothetical protein